MVGCPLLCLPRRAHRRAVFSPREGCSPGEVSTREGTWVEMLNFSRAHLLGCGASSPYGLHICWSQHTWSAIFICSGFLHSSASRFSCLFWENHLGKLSNDASKEWRRSHDTKAYIPARKLNSFFPLLLLKHLASRLWALTKKLTCDSLCWCLQLFHIRSGNKIKSM